MPIPILVIKKDLRKNVRNETKPRANRLRHQELLRRKSDILLLLQTTTNRRETKKTTRKPDPLRNIHVVYRKMPEIQIERKNVIIERKIRPKFVE